MVVGRNERACNRFAARRCHRSGRLGLYVFLNAKSTQRNRRLYHAMQCITVNTLHLHYKMHDLPASSPGSGSKANIAPRNVPPSVSYRSHLIYALATTPACLEPTRLQARVEPERVERT